MITHLGIDFGARFAGTTAICLALDNRLKVFQSPKKSDADEFCRHHIAQYHPNFVMIDAPLSIPKVYTNPELRLSDLSADYFFRKADRELNAMSPMFLGGLTARAMQLSTYFAARGVLFFETWPTAIRPRFGGTQRPHVGLLESHLYNTTGLELEQAHQLSIHGIDSVLVWYAGWLKTNGLAKVFGDADEGLIWC